MFRRFSNDSNSSATCGRGSGGAAIVSGELGSVSCIKVRRASSLFQLLTSVHSGVVVGVMSNADSFPTPPPLPGAAAAAPTSFAQPAAPQFVHVYVSMDKAAVVSTLSAPAPPFALRVVPGSGMSLYELLDGI